MLDTIPCLLCRLPIVISHTLVLFVVLLLLLLLLLLPCCLFHIHLFWCAVPPEAATPHRHSQKKRNAVRARKWLAQLRLFQLAAIDQTERLWQVSLLPSLCGRSSSLPLLPTFLLVFGCHTFVPPFAVSLAIDFCSYSRGSTRLADMLLNYFDRNLFLTFLGTLLLACCQHSSSVLCWQSFAFTRHMCLSSHSFHSSHYT